VKYTVVNFRISEQLCIFIKLSEQSHVFDLTLSVVYRNRGAILLFDQGNSFVL